MAQASERRGEPRRRRRAWLLCLVIVAALTWLLVRTAGCGPAPLSPHQVLACELQAELAAQGAVNAAAYDPPLPWGVRRVLDRDARCWTDLVRILRRDPRWSPPTSQPDEEAWTWHEGRADCWW